MIRLDELYSECVTSLNSMTDEEFDLFNQQAINESRDSFLLGDLDEDELEMVVYNQTPTQRIVEQKRTAWAQGMLQSFMLIANATKSRYVCVEEAA